MASLGPARASPTLQDQALPTHIPYSTWEPSCCFPWRSQNPDCWNHLCPLAILSHAWLGAQQSRLPTAPAHTPQPTPAAPSPPSWHHTGAQCYIPASPSLFGHPASCLCQPLPLVALAVAVWLPGASTWPHSPPLVSSISSAWHGPGMELEEPGHSAPPEERQPKASQRPS